MIRMTRMSCLAVCLSLYLLCFLASPAVAGMMGTVASDRDAGNTRADELTRIQRTLETEIVKEKLGAYGLTPDEISQRLEGLSHEQIHLLAQASDDVLAGGNGEGVIIALLIILIILLVIYATGHRVIVK